MKLSKRILKSMIRAIKMTRDEEIGCDECFDKLNEYAEMELAGKSPEEAMPLVRDHLDKCTECQEEYMALLDALKELKVEST
jgi:hypothetical protein